MQADRTDGKTRAGEQPGVPLYDRYARLEDVLVVEVPGD